VPGRADAPTASLKNIDGKRYKDVGDVAQRAQPAGPVRRAAQLHAAVPGSGVHHGDEDHHVLTLIVVIVPNVFGLVVALLLNRCGWSSALNRVILSSVVVSVVWTRLLDTDGPLDEALRRPGVSHTPGWLSDPSLGLYSVRPPGHVPAGRQSTAIRSRSGAYAPVL
jgi:hypothetical protein